VTKPSTAATCLLALVLGACIGGGQDAVTPAPTPPTATTPAEVASVAVILPPRGSISEEAADSLERAAESAVSAADREVALRVVRPDGAEFVVGIAGLLADDGFDLVCVLGASAAAAVAEVAAQQPGTRFCMTGPVAGGPQNLWAPTLRHREAAWLAGVAAALARDGGPVGMIVREGEPALSAKRASFDLGFAAAAEAPPGEDTVPPTVGTIALQDEQPAPVVDAVLSQEPSVLVVDVGPLTEMVIARIAEAASTTPVIAWTGIEEQFDGPADSLLIVAELVTAFRLALEAVLAGTFDALPESIGLADGAFVVRRANPADSLTDLQPWIDDIVSGRVNVATDP
jgi:basic membrane lipoprotein Med (substrate-binding protein (PBP1-ABC) superfamily)